LNNEVMRARPGPLNNEVMRARPGPRITRKFVGGRHLLEL